MSTLAGVLSLTSALFLVATVRRLRPDAGRAVAPFAIGIFIAGASCCLWAQVILS